MGEESRQIAVIVNPTKVNLPQLQKTFHDLTSNHVQGDAGEARRALGWAPPIWHITTPDDNGQAAAQRALDAGADLICVAGGDGTVRAVAEGMRGSSVPLGLIPSGTGNLLARNLSVPVTNTAEAVSIALAGATRPVDLAGVRIIRETGEINEHSFLVLAGMGIDAAMIANTNSNLKKAVGWLAYVDAAVRSLSSTKPFHVHYTLGGKAEHSLHLSTILFANCGTLTGGIELIPDALVDDGMLDIAVLQPKGLAGWVQVWRKVRWENSILRRSSMGRRMIQLTDTRKEATVTYLRSAAASIRLDRPEPIELDGDEFGIAVGAEFFVDEIPLNVCVRASPEEKIRPGRPQ